MNVLCFNRENRTRMNLLTDVFLFLFFFFFFFLACRFCQNCRDPLMRGQIDSGVRVQVTNQDLLKVQSVNLQDTIDSYRATEKAAEKSHGIGTELAHSDVVWDKEKCQFCGLRHIPWYDRFVMFQLRRHFPCSAIKTTYERVRRGYSHKATEWLILWDRVKEWRKYRSNEELLRQTIKFMLLFPEQRPPTSEVVHKRVWESSTSLEKKNNNESDSTWRRPPSKQQTLANTP